MTIPVTRPAWNWRRRRARKLLADHDVRRHVRELVAHVDARLATEAEAERELVETMRARDRAALAEAE